MNTKYQKLIASIVLDAIGLIPIPFLDVVWAPLSGYIMTKMYKGKAGKIAGVVSFIEEILPLDVVPTFTIMWIYSYLIHKKEETTIVDV